MQSAAIYCNFKPITFLLPFSHFSNIPLHPYTKVKLLSQQSKIYYKIQSLQPYGFVRILRKNTIYYG